MDKHKNCKTKQSKQLNKSIKLIKNIVIKQEKKFRKYKK